MVAQSPDWFVGVSGLPLLDAQGDWLSSRSLNLYPWDAGTEEGDRVFAVEPRHRAAGSHHQPAGVGQVLE